MTRCASAEHGFLCEIHSSPFSTQPLIITPDSLLISIPQPIIIGSQPNAFFGHFFTEININSDFFFLKRRGRSFSWENMEKQVGQLTVTLLDLQASWLKWFSTVLLLRFRSIFSFSFYRYICLVWIWPWKDGYRYCSFSSVIWHFIHKTKNCVVVQDFIYLHI